MQPIIPNDPSASAQRTLGFNNARMLSSLQRLATGERINRAADDPAGLIASENLRAVLAELDAEARSLQRTDHVADTADGAMAQMSDLLSQASGLVVAAANDSVMSDEERAAIQMELDSVVSSIDRIAGSTTFNGDTLLDGTAELRAGAASVTIDNLSSGALGEVEIDGEAYTLAAVRSGGALSLDSGNVAAAQQVIGAARSQLSAMRGKIGAFQNDLVGSRLNSLGNTIAAVAGAESSIRDTDYALETANLARLRMLQAASLRAVALASGRQEDILALIS